jgi:hypothetical protein
VRGLIIKSYFLFFIYLGLSLGVFFIAYEGPFSSALFGVVIIGVALYSMRLNLQLKSVEFDRIILSFAYIKKHILYKNIKEVKFLNIGKNNLLGDVDQFSIKTVKNKYFEVSYLVSSGDFEKIQEKVAQAHLHTGSSNVPK